MYAPRCGKHEPFLSPSVPDTPLTVYEDRGTWDLRVAPPSKEHWALLEDKAFQLHILRLDAQCLEDAQKLEETQGRKTLVTRKKATTKPSASTTGTTKHPPLIKHSKSALKKLLEADQIPENTGDEDLLLSEIGDSLLDRPASDKIIEDVSDLLNRIRSFQLQVLYEMGSIQMINRTLAEGFSTEFICISSLVSEDLSLSVCSHQEWILSASTELERGILRLLNTPVLSVHARAISSLIKKFAHMVSVNTLLPLMQLEEV